MITKESKKRRLNLAWLVAACLAVVFMASGLAQEEPPVEEPPLPEERALDEELLMPGTIEGTGTYFEVINSEYLNIVLQSTEPVNLRLESVPQMVVMDIGAAEGATSTRITLTGFAPSTTYYKYEDDYHNEVAFTTDEYGSYTFAQDLTIAHHVFIQPQAGTRYIPSDTEIGTWDSTNRIYTLKTDVYETIQVDEDNLTLDGAGHNINGTGSGAGVYLPWTSGSVTVKNLNVQAFFQGITVCSSNNTLTGNTCSNNKHGIYLYNCSNNTLAGNIASQNAYYGIHLCYNCSNNTLTGNIASQNTRGISLYLGSSNNTLTDNTCSNNTYGIHLLENCTNNALRGNTASQNDRCGIYLDLSGKNTLTGNTASQNTYGMWLDGFCNYNTLTSNIVDLNTYYGIYLNYYSSYNTLRDNTASRSNYGIFLRAVSKNNTLTGNTCSNNKYGIYFYHHCSNNTLKGNTVSNNTWGTYCINSSNNNRFYNNNFISNSTQAYVYASSGNLFNLEKPVGGNYWSDYTGEDTDGDGIGDTKIPYTFTGGKDYLPWVVQNGWVPFWIEQLIDDVAALNLQKGIDNSLDAKLEAAGKALDDVNENNDVAAINTLQAFINAVEGQRGNKIPYADADALIAAAQEIIAMLSNV